MADVLSIELLVRQRARELGLAPTGLIRRAGYANVSKGLRRLSELHQGNFDSSRGLIGKLPSALQLPPDDVRRAVEDSRRQRTEAKEARWRSAFVPHALVLTECARPHPLHIAAVIGIDELKRVDFTPGSRPVSYIQQALDGLQEKLMRWGGGQLPCFGKHTGIIVNYTPDCAVRFDLNASAIENFDAAHRLGEATLSISGRKLSATALRTVLSK